MTAYSYFGSKPAVQIETTRLISPGDTLRLTYSRTLEALFFRDGHPVTVRDSPDLNLDGVIVVDASWLDRIQCSLRPERFIVIASRSAPINQIDLWVAGIRQVVYWEDPIAEVHLAIVAAALGLTNREGLMRDAAI